MTKKIMAVFVLIITVLLCLQSSGALAQFDPVPVAGPGSAPGVFPGRAGSLPSLHSFQPTMPPGAVVDATEPVTINPFDPVDTDVFGTGSAFGGSGSLPSVGFGGSEKPPALDPLKPVDTDVFGTGSLYDWLFPADGGDHSHDSALCPWKQ